MPKSDAEPKDAGLLVMLVLVILGTLVMAWVAENAPQASSQDGGAEHAASAER